MITRSMVYWITRLDYIHCFGIFLTIVGIILIAAIFIRIDCIRTEIKWDLNFGDKYGNIKGLKKLPSNQFVLFLIPSFILFISASIMIFLPSTKEMCAILIIPKVANSQEVQQCGKDVIDLKNMALEYLKEKMEVKK